VAVYLVFSQSRDAALDVDALDAHARRFFGARVTGHDADARIAVTLEGAVPSPRAAQVRAATSADLALADEAEARMGGGGLASLAKRCPTVVEIEREGDDDRDALRVAALLASVLLGPIVDPRGPDILGAKTARSKLTV
jgi:hypothetical protein